MEHQCSITTNVLISYFHCCSLHYPPSGWILMSLLGDTWHFASLTLGFQQQANALGATQTDKRDLQLLSQPFSSSTASCRGQRSLYTKREVG